jgi:hypothetical protein
VDGNPLALGALALLATYVWTYASLAAVQLTVRLILRFDLLETARAAVWLSVAVIVVGALLLWLTGQAIDPAMVEYLRGVGEARGGGGRTLGRRHGSLLLWRVQRLSDTRLVRDGERAAYGAAGG